MRLARGRLKHATLALGLGLAAPKAIEVAVAGGSFVRPCQASSESRGAPAGHGPAPECRTASRASPGPESAGAPRGFGVSSLGVRRRTARRGAPPPCPRRKPPQGQVRGGLRRRLFLLLGRRRSSRPIGPHCGPVRPEARREPRDAGRGDTTCRWMRATIGCPGCPRSQHSSSSEITRCSVARVVTRMALTREVPSLLHVPFWAIKRLLVAGPGLQDFPLVPPAGIGSAGPWYRLFWYARAAVCLRQDRPRGVRDRPSPSRLRARRERWHGQSPRGGRDRPYRGGRDHRGARDAGRPREDLASRDSCRHPRRPFDPVPSRGPRRPGHHRDRPRRVQPVSLRGRTLRSRRWTSAARR